ncbi:MAG: ABC transporter permease [Verrucomicrobiales bacterium]|jgi:putative ABC transport system permease protein|nr:ABC transporter permease [Verrucomicrobiales bacterium]MBP9223789.1 ABC transporter permease [Verrucomicrobiales bacterium]
MLWNALLIALREIRRNLTRAFLTVLGIIIGVAAVVTMVTLGQGTTQAVKNQISNLGTNLLTLRPGSGYGPRSGVPQFTQADAEIIGEQIGGIAAVAPLMSASMSSIYLQNARSTQITGTTPEYFMISKWTISQGRFFTEQDYRTGGAVCVIGATTKKELFGSEDAIGKKIRLGKASCTIIGLLVPKGQSFGGDQDDTIVVPLTTLQRRLVGRTSARDVREIMISAEDGADTDLIISDINNLMRQRRSLQRNEPDNFSVRDTRQLAETLSASTKMMTSLLAAVAGVSLLVGGIGIMNIMLVSVTERTREIGIRLAIGARAREVLLQFLVEAVTLSSIGGIIGISLALGLCVFLADLIEVPFLFDPHINIIAFFFSTAVGVIFGFAPARRAAALDPIEALRHE